MTRSNDSGAVTVWVLCAGLVLVLVAAATALAGAAMAARHRAQAAADLAALAGALLAWDGEPAACDRAADISARNGAQLVACRLDGLDLVVTAEVTGAAHVGVARASARAGPVALPRPGGYSGLGRAGMRAEYATVHMGLVNDHKGQSAQT